MECGVWSVELGVWSLECGVGSVELGVGSLEFGNNFSHSKLLLLALKNSVNVQEKPSSSQTKMSIRL